MLQTQDPNYTGFTGKLFTDLKIGHGDAVVEVEAVIDDDDTVSLTVMYRGVDITDAVGLADLQTINNHLSANWQTLVHDATIWKASDYEG